MHPHFAPNNDIQGITGIPLFKHRIVSFHLNRLEEIYNLGQAFRWRVTEIVDAFSASILS